jgi:hypothetical protein
MVSNVGEWLYHSIFDPGGGLFTLICAGLTFVWAHRWWRRQQDRIARLERMAHRPVPTVRYDEFLSHYHRDDGDVGIDLPRLRRARAERLEDQ